jgi:NitT/TauT family transport system substrate-binding protein
MPSVLAKLRHFLVLLSALAALPAAAQTPLKLVLPFSFQGALGSWTLAEADGCYRRHGLAVTIDGGAGSGDAISKVAAGAYDIGIADFTAIVLFGVRQPVVGLAVVYVMWDRAPTSVAALKRSGIRKPADLAGKRIGDPVGEASRELFPAFAIASGLDPKSVEWINVAINLRQTALFRGEYDAAAGHMYTITSGLRAIGVADDDVVVMPYADYGIEIFGNSVFVKSAWAAAHQQELKAFLVCADDGMKAAIADPKAAIASLKPHNSMLDERQANDELKFSNSFSILTPNVKANGLSAVDAARLDKVLSTVALAYQIEKPAPGIWTDAYLPPEADRKVAGP